MGRQGGRVERVRSGERREEVRQSVATLLKYALIV